MLEKLTSCFVSRLLDDIHVGIFVRLILTEHVVWFVFCVAIHAVEVVMCRTDKQDIRNIHNLHTHKNRFRRNQKTIIVK